MIAQPLPASGPPPLPSDMVEPAIPQGAEPESAIHGPIAGRYDVGERIARGGMGIVFRAHDRLLNRTVAVKVLRSRFMDRPDLLRRFLAEARINGKLQHPGVVPVYEVGTLADTRPFIAMKLIEGHTLARQLRDRPTPADNQAHYLKVFEALCQTVAYAHRQGVIHRDLKPENVMVGEFGEVQVMDWGLAKFLNPADAVAPTPDGFEAVERSVYLSGDGLLPPGEYPTQATAIRAVGPEDPNFEHTSAGEVFGTAPYMPPEQARGEIDRVDRRSDVFALGAILCQILTGQPPYFGAPETIRDQARAGKLFGAYVLLDRSGADQTLILLCKHCLATDQNSRPADAGVLAGMVTQCLERLQDRTRQLEMDRLSAEARVAEAEAREKLARKARRLSRSLAVVSVIVAALLAAWVGWITNHAVVQASDESHRHVVAVHQVEAALADAEARHEEARTAPGGPLVRQAAARQALADCQRAENLLAAAPELRGTLDALKARVIETQREIELVIALDEWRGGLIDAAGNIDRAAAARRCREIFAAHGLEPAAAAGQAHRHPVVRDTLADWLAVTPDGGEQAELESVLCENAGGLSREWVRVLRSTSVEEFIRVADRPGETKIPVASYVLAADQLIADRKPADVERLLLRGVRQHPNEFALNARFGALLRAEGQSVRSIRYLTAAHAARPGDLAVYRDLGLALADADRADEAIEVLRGVAQADPKRAAVHTRLGDLYLARGDADAARTSFGAAIAVEPTNGPAHLGLARAELGRGDLDAAAKAFETAAHTPAHAAVAHAGLGKIHLQRWEAAKAVTRFRSAVEAEPTNLDYRLGLVESLRVANDLPGAVKEARAAATAFPKAATAHRALGDLLLKTDDPAAAAIAYKAAVQADPSDHALRRRLGRLLADREDESALDELKAAVGAAPESGEVRSELAYALAQLGRFRAAATTYREAAETYPEDSPQREAARSAARAATRLAGLEDRLPELAGGAVVPSSPAAWAEVGEVCRRTKRYAAAARFYAEAAAGDSKYAGPAARCAALAGFGRGGDAKDSSEDARAGWRKSALAGFQKWPNWANDPALDGLRDEWNDLPAKEREAWQAVWMGR